MPNPVVPPEAMREPASPAAADALRIGGLTRLTGVDFPGRLAAVVFLQGCPWCCVYCHNPALLDAAVPGALAWSAVRAFLQQRRGLLDGVVFSGGEPTLQAALVPALAEARVLGYACGLHTGGMYPDRLAQSLPHLDWVGLDIKAPRHLHDAVTGTRGGAGRAASSLSLLLDSGVALECRTTWHAGLFGRDDLFRLADELAAQSVRHWVLQTCRGPGPAPQPLGPGDLAALASHFERFECR